VQLFGLSDFWGTQVEHEEVFPVLWRVDEDPVLDPRDLSFAVVFGVKDELLSAGCEGLLFVL
jgi:hypothetical protein